VNDGQANNHLKSASSAPNGFSIINGNGRHYLPDALAEASEVPTSRARDLSPASAGFPFAEAIRAVPPASQANGTGQTESVPIPRWKRILDLTCIWLTAPLWGLVMALVAIWILLVSPGPLLFRQERVGYRGRRFMILKFRTMKINAETQVHEGYFERLMQADCPMTKLDCQDARLIRGGRPLRALGLDELPQIFNVLRGEMSLVGPRPCTPHEFARYQPGQRERVNAPPGLTGYWQVNGKNKTTFSRMIEMDKFYATNMSLKMDLAIMLRTLPAIAVQVLESRTVKSKGSRIKSIIKEHFAKLRRKAAHGKQLS
jgi:lipopolysaccharide/colanic/teichoic acid biosynthesis glycosyltransferase